MHKIRLINWSISGTVGRLGKYITVYTANYGIYKAYLIRRSDINKFKKEDFYGELAHLFNNYGIYFLFGDESLNNGKKGIYVGQASERSNPSGINRLKEHNSDTKEKFYSKWDFALFITTANNSLTTGDLDYIEHYFISAINNSIDDYINFNTKPGNKSNVDASANALFIEGIIELLESPNFEYKLKYEDKDIKNDEYIKDNLNVQYLNSLSLLGDVQVSLEKVLRQETYDDFKSKLGDYTANGRIVTFEVSKEILTPKWIADNMINTIINHKDFKILNIYCKDGVYITSRIDNIMDKAYSEKLSTMELRKILDTLIDNTFGICAAHYSYITSCYNVIKCIEKHIVRIYGDKVKIGELNTRIPKIFYIKGYTDYVKRLSKDNNEFKKFLSHKLGYKGDITNMKFDAVIGNPPYNDDIYLDFVEKAKDLSDNVCMITPARWQGKGGEKNEAFHNNVVPYMDKATFYPVAGDIFDIAVPGGISIINVKNVKGKTQVKTICSCDKLSCDYEEHDEEKLILYNKKIVEILKKCDTDKNIINKLTLKDKSNSFLRSFYLGESFKASIKEKDDINYIGCYSGNNLVGFVDEESLYTKQYLDKWKITQTVMLSAGVWASIPNYGISPLNKLSPYNVPIGSYPVVAIFDSEVEADSFLSYANTKLIRFLHYIGVRGTTENSTFWSFIPDPGKFDHIFTNKELYEKYNISDSEKEIIEAIIKDRK